MVETSQACAVAQGMPCETQMHVEVQGEVTVKKKSLVGYSLWKEKGRSRRPLCFFLGLGFWLNTKNIQKWMGSTL